MKRLQDTADLIGAMALFIVMSLIFASVIARYFFDVIIPDAFDFSRMFLGITIFWGIAGAVSRRGLITADFLYQSLRRNGRRVLDTIGACVTFLILAILCWRLWLTVADSYSNGIRTQDTGIPLWGFYTAAAFALLVALAFALKHATDAIAGHDPEAGA